MFKIKASVPQCFHGECVFMKVARTLVCSIYKIDVAHIIIAEFFKSYTFLPCESRFLITQLKSPLIAAAEFLTWVYGKLPSENNFFKR